MSAQAPSSAALSETVASAAAGAAVYVCRADYANPRHAQVLVELLDAYAQDPMGGAEPLSDFAKQNLVACLAARPQAFTCMTWRYWRRIAVSA